MTDSVLSALLPQLNQPFNRMLLLVIADRADEVEAGSGEGWRVLHEYQRQPTPYRYVCYWSLLRKGDEPFAHRLPPYWFNRVLDRRDVTAYTMHHTTTPSIADFSSYALAYQVAAEEWLCLGEYKKKCCLEALK